MACKHTSETALDKAQVTLRIPVRLKHLVLSKFGKKGDAGQSEPFIRALEKSVEGVVVSKRMLDAIRAEMQSNYEKRMETRKRVNRYFRANKKDYSEFQK